MTAKTSTYTGGVVKKGLAGVRERLSVYIGSTGVLSEGHMPRALAQMAQETISNSLDEFVAGYGDEIAITINADGSMTVLDHGRGLPKGPNSEFTNVINMLTEPHGSGKFDDSAYAALGVAGMNGLGMKAVNAGSKKLVVEACCTASKPNPDDPAHPLPRNCLEEYRIEFKQDKVIAKEIVKKRSDGPTYTKVTFWPDDGPTSETKPEPVLESVDWIVDDLKPRLEASAFLMPGVRITLEDRREGREQSLEWCYEHGLEDYLSQLLEGSVVLGAMEDSAVVVDKTLSTPDGAFQLRAAFTYTESIGADIVSFANGVPTGEGGPHLDGFRKALLDTFNEFSSTRKLSKKKLTADDVVDGLVAVFETRVPSKIADFEGQTKEKLATVQAKDATASMLSEALTQWLFENEKAGKEIVSKMVESASARDAAMKARKEAKEARKARASSGLDLRVSSKLKACSSKNPEERELFITEGDSASGFKRDVRTQAIFPLRGKILNIYKADIGRALKNEEISTIVSVLGSGIGPTFNVDEMQYGKVIIANDADPDGFHIRTLCTGIFYKFFPGLIDAGKLYAVETPLYRAAHYVKGKLETRMFYSESEMESAKDEIVGWDISRFKGLGEMDKNTEAYEAITNPATRHLTRITQEDARRSAKMLKTLLGPDSAPRKKWLEENVDFSSLD